MGTSRGPSVSRLKTIMRRQNHTTWDADYMPAILATRGEAPSISHALTLTPEKLFGRDVHLLSLPESFAALLGLYHPNVVGLQEQRMLSPGPRLHPLHTFPNGNVLYRPPFKGMIDVAERLGYLSMLPRVRIEDPEQKGLRREVVFPYVGDLLWAIRDSTGRYYCVNWSVKDSESAFKRPLKHERFVTPTKQVLNGLLARHEMECAYYADAGIRTVLLAGDAIDENVSSNLRHLFLHHRRPVTINAQERLELLARFQNCIDIGVPPFELIARLAGGGKYSVKDCRNVLLQGIWNRTLRVDLLRPILINRPLHPEAEDVIDRYADWFSEAAC
jgi:hypothetical protein